MKTLQENVVCRYSSEEGMGIIKRCFVVGNKYLATKVLVESTQEVYWRIDQDKNGLKKILKDSVFRKCFKTEGV